MFRKIEIWLPWLVVLGLNLALIIAGTPAYVRVLSSPCQPGSCVFFQLSLGSAQALGEAGFGSAYQSASFYARFLAVLTLGSELLIDVLAILLFWKNWRSRMALFMSYFLLTLGSTFFFALTESLIAQQPGWRVPVNLMSALGIWCWITFGFLFPDGRFIYRWIFWFVWLAAAATLMMFSFSSLAAIAVPKTALEWLLFILLVSLLGSGALFQIYRYRRISGAVEKQQTKWIVFGFALFALEAILFGFVGVLIPAISQPGLPNALYYLAGGTLNVILLLVMLGCILIAILRYHIWDIDVIIRRTLLYSLLTGLLGLGYFSVITLLQNLFTSISGQTSPAALVISTLLIAALFTPLRRRLQNFIDRRFYRRKYDAQQALAQFAASARAETDLQVLSGKLLSVTQESLQPQALSLWFKEKP